MRGFLGAVWLLSGLLCVTGTHAASAGATAADPARERVRVFLDCADCDEDFLHENLLFVDYVRDRAEADVHVLVSSQETGSGGVDQTVTILGQARCAGLADTLHVFSAANDSEDMQRQRFARLLARGLARYAVRLGAADGMAIATNERDGIPAPRSSAHDPWNAWVFSLSGNGWMNGQQAQSLLGLYGEVSADRVTDAWKHNWSLGTNYNRQSYQLSAEKLVSSSDNYSMRGTVVKSCGDHWSAGGFVRASRSSYDNVDLLLSLQPALEYNVYPYAASTRQSLRLLYHTGPKRYVYAEETVFGKMRESVWVEALDATLSRKEPWGSTSLYLSASHYWHDFRRNRAEISGNLQFRVSQGLSFNVNGNYSRVHDQLALPRRGATDEEILLQRRALASGYYYSTSVGISYSFGSIFNNVVNPRFGS